MGANEETEKRLSYLQNKWLNDKDEEAYHELYIMLVQYARSQILKITKGKKFLNPDYVMTKAVDATNVFIEQYEKNPEFRVDYSFGGLLRYKVLEVMYAKKIKRDDKVLSLNSIIGSATNERELEDLQEKLDIKPYWSNESEVQDPVVKMFSSEENTIRIVTSVLHDLKNSGTLTLSDQIIVYMAFVHMFRRSKNLNKFIETFMTKEKLCDIFELSKLEIRNRLLDEA